MIEHNTIKINSITFEYFIKAYDESSEAEAIHVKDNERMARKMQ